MIINNHMIRIHDNKWPPFKHIPTKYKTVTLLYTHDSHHGNSIQNNTVQQTSYIQ